MSEYRYTAPSGIWVESCKAPYEDPWARSNWAYARRSYWSILVTALWKEPKRSRQKKREARSVQAGTKVIQ